MDNPYDDIVDSINAQYLNGAALSTSASLDDGSGESDTKVSTQKAVKTYIDARVISYGNPQTRTYLKLVAPTISDDIALGYFAGDLWRDTVTNILYIADDVTAGAAVWSTYLPASTDGTMAGNSDSEVPTEKAVKTYSTPLSYLDTDGTLAANSDTKIATQKAIKTYVETSVETSMETNMPIGTILPYSGITVPNASWLFCDGSAISKTTYSLLWSKVSNSAIGTAGTGACAFADAGDIVTCAGHGLATGNSIYFRTIVSTTGISVDANYFVIYVDVDTFKVASTLALAQAGTALPLTTNGTGTLTYVPFGISGANDFLIPDTRAVTLKGTGNQTINARVKSGPAFGAVEEDQMQGHYHNFQYTAAGVAGGAVALVGGVSVSGSSVTAPVTDGTNGTPRTGTTTRDNTLGVNYIIKVI